MEYREWSDYIMRGNFYWQFSDYSKWDCVFCSLTNCKHTDCMRHLNNKNYQDFITGRITKQPNIVNFNSDDISCSSYAR